MADSNEAQIVITTDYASFKEFIEYSKSGMGNFEKQGRQAFTSFSKAARDSLTPLVATAALIGHEMSSAISKPLNTSLDGLLDKARKLREELTGTSISTGKPAKNIEEQINAAASKANVLPAEAMTWAQQVRKQTGSWDNAIGAMPIWAGQARLRNQSLEETAPMAAAVQNNLKLRTPEAQEKFLNRAWAHAKAAGGNPEQAMMLLERKLGVLSQTGSSPEAISRFTAAMSAQADGNIDLASSNIDAMVGFVKSRDPFKLEGELKRRGISTKSLYNRRGQVDVIAALEAIAKDQFKYRGDRSRRRAYIQNLGGTTPAAAMEEYGETLDRMDRAGKAREGQSIGQSQRTYDMSEEGLRKAKDRTAEQKNLELGRKELEEQERSGVTGRGGMSGKVGSYAGHIPFVGHRIAGGVATALDEGPEVPRLSEKQRTTMTEKERQEAIEARRGYRKIPILRSIVPKDDRDLDPFAPVAPETRKVQDVRIIEHPPNMIMDGGRQ